MSKLIFVYALDGGLFNGITHYAHKVLAPRTYPCNLCAITNNMLGTKREWAQFLHDIGIETEFLHSDEFKQSHPNAQDALPAVYRSTGNSNAELFMTSAEINACHDLSSLISLVSDRLKGKSQTASS